MVASKLSLPGILALLIYSLLTPQFTNAADKWVEVSTPHFTISSNAGEHEARRIAQQFEEIREVFHVTFPTLRLDAGKPMLVIAAKNESEFKVLLPDYYVSKDQKKLAGMFVPAYDRDFALVRTDVTGTGENPYHSLYHEYTHFIIRLNFSYLPTWLNEGLADFYGNTLLEGFQTGIGKISINQLRVMQHFPFIPLETLLSADQRSPLYNERDRATMFYAESWALVHLLMLDPDARKEQLLSKYLKAMDGTNDSLEAARSAFGDLKKFGTRLELYTRQSSFYYQTLKNITKYSDKDYSAREMSPAETLVIQSDLLEHMGHSREALPLLKQAVELQPTLASAHAALGLYHYQQHNNDDAEKEYKLTEQLDPKEFRAPYYLAELQIRRDGYTGSSTPQIVANLEKALNINPNFGPGYAVLCLAYMHREETKQKAVGAAVQAVKLQPSRLLYAVYLGDALIAAKRDADARAIAEKLKKAAKDPAEKSLAENFSKRLVRYEEGLSAKPGSSVASSANADDFSNSNDSDFTTTVVVAPAPTTETNNAAHTEEGVIQEVECSKSLPISMKFAILGSTLTLGAADIEKIKILTNGKESNIAENSCDKWKGRKARISYESASDTKTTGKILSIEFL